MLTNAASGMCRASSGDSWRAEAPTKQIRCTDWDQGLGFRDQGLDFRFCLGFHIHPRPVVTIQRIRTPKSKSFLIRIRVLKPQLLVACTLTPTLGHKVYTSYLLWAVYTPYLLWAIYSPTVLESKQSPCCYWTLEP